MNSLFSFQFGEFGDSGPSWFDWFSLVITSLISILSIIGGFLIATKIYSKEKRDKQNEDNDIQASEVGLFKNNLSQLKESITDQIKKLEEYQTKKDFKIQFSQGVHAGFLYHVDVKYLYKDVGLENTNKIIIINKLLSGLYVINDFRTFLRDEFRSYMVKYNFHEDKFYTYRKLLYTKYFELCNQRGFDFTIANGVKKWKIANDDLFMKQYSEVRESIFNDGEVISENGLNDRQKLIERFIKPLIKISNNSMPEDYNAIEVNDMANEVNSAFLDMSNVSQVHFHAVASYLASLKDIHTKITTYLS
ncbi:MAG: hypothetical protein ACTHMM_13355 [Agriterribacter sp.]